MPLTINLVLFKRKQRKDGTIPIYLRITQNQKSKYKSSGVAVLPHHWHAKDQVIRRTHKDYKKLNRKLRKFRREFEEKRDELEIQEQLDINILKSSVVKDSNPNDLITRAEAYHDSLNGTERFHEWKKFGVVLNNLKSYLEDRKINILDVDSGFIEDFQEFLLTRVNYDKEKEQYYGNNPNTVRRKLRSLKAMFTRMLKRKEIKHDPFMAVEKVSKRPTSKTKLSPEQIEAIQKADLPKGSDLWHVRNYFLYSFYNAGIRFGDICTLTWNNIVDGRLVYSMNKTGGQKNIKQLRPMLEILTHYQKANNSRNDYIFPILDRTYDDPFELRKAIAVKNVGVNKRLKELATEVGIEANVSFHISRHSFAHYALKKDMDLYSISKALAHSDISKTEQYLKSFDEEKLDSDMESIFS